MLQLLSDCHGYHADKHVTGLKNFWLFDDEVSTANLEGGRGGNNHHLAPYLISMNYCTELKFGSCKVELRSCHYKRF